MIVEAALHLVNELVLPQMHLVALQAAHQASALMVRSAYQVQSRTALQARHVLLEEQYA